jgi:8-oxo-dGTP pyrophosphatase MutT (NUDIX family)
MPLFQELSAGVIPFRRTEDHELIYLVLHSATVRNPRARWEFPKGGIEPGETPRIAAAREFREETSLIHWEFRDGFERNLTYSYIRRGRRVMKTVTYYVVEVADDAGLTRSAEHVPDAAGHWHRWGTFPQITRLLFHAKIRQLFEEADLWIRNGLGDPPPGQRDGAASTTADAGSESLVPRPPHALPAPRPLDPEVRLDDPDRV